MAVARNTKKFFRLTHSLGGGGGIFGRSISNRPRTAAEQVRPDGLDMTCQEHQIRELVTVGMAGRVAMEWAGLAKVHSDQPYHSRSDVNAGLVVGW